MKEKKLRIFINSNAIWSTSGYGQQLAEFLPYWRDAGYPIATCAFYGLEGSIIKYDGIVHYPKINHVYGSDALIHHAKDWKADVVFTLQDAWVLNPEDLQKVPKFIPIVPIDHEPVPRIVLEKLRLAYRIVTYSKFGHAELARQGIHSTYIPHTVNTKIFKPIDRAARKKSIGLKEDSFICGMVAANKENPPRKSFQEVMDAFKMFLQTVPNAHLYVHTNPSFPGGFPVIEYGNFIGIKDKLIFPSMYDMNFKTSKEQMALIYGMMDVLLMPSVNEGFGVPAIEAQACGVPVIVNNFTSMPELIKKGVTGEACDVLYKRFSQLGSYVGVPSAKSIYDCLVKIYQADRNAMGKAAREFMVEEYDTKKVVEGKWLPYLEQLEAEIYP